MRPNESGITRASMSHTIGSLNDLRIFVARSSTDSITCDTIRKRSKACSIPFFEPDVELFMRGYIARSTACRKIGTRLGTGVLKYPSSGCLQRFPLLQSASWCPSAPLGTRHYQRYCRQSARRGSTIHLHLTRIDAFPLAAPWFAQTLLRASASCANH